MKILSFGHIPSWAGGQQNSGLANVIYHLSKNIAECEDVEEVLVATDVYVPQKKDEDLTIYGWSKKILIKYVVSHPFITCYWLYSVLKAKIKYGPIVNVLSYFFKGLQLRKYIDSFGPDYVHLHGMGACVYQRIIPSNIKVIVTMHGLIGNNHTISNHKYRRLMEADICKSNRLYKIFFIAQQLIVDFERIYGKIVSLTVAIPNSYDSKSFYYIEHKKQIKPTLVTVASLSENKGQKRVIEAIAKTKLDLKYICIGAGTENIIKEYDDFAKINNVDYEYVGKKTPSEIREILSMADYMILPSSTEGFGLVYLESIACGVPVILPKHLPIVSEEEIIKKENSILLDDSGVDAIVSVLYDLNLYSFNHIEVANSIIDYSWDNIAKKYINQLN